MAIDGLRALEERHGVRSVAFEMLGPPRLTKLLYEAYLLSRLYPSRARARDCRPGVRGRECERLIREKEPMVRRQILSVGLPILLANGEQVLRGETVVVPPDGRGADIASRGWVDLRPANLGAVDQAGRRRSRRGARRPHRLERAMDRDRPRCGRSSRRGWRCGSSKKRTRGIRIKR